MSDLKPCPHCGELPDIVETNSGFQALCSGCDMATYSDDWTEKKAIEIWNARHSGWISVDDRLPDDREYVICFGLAEGRIAHWFGFLIKDAGWFLDGASGLTERNITHWMPLPNPPKQ